MKTYLIRYNGKLVKVVNAISRQHCEELIQRKDVDIERVDNKVIGIYD